MLVRVLSSLCWVWVGCLGLNRRRHRGPLVISGAKGDRAASYDECKRRKREKGRMMATVV